MQKASRLGMEASEPMRANGAGNETMNGPWNWVNRVVRNWAGQFLLLAVGTSAIGVVFSLSMAADMGWKRAMEQGLADSWAWGLLVPLIVALDRRLPFNWRRLSSRMFAHCIVCLVVTGLYLYVFFFLQVLLGVETWGALRISQMFSMARLGWFVWSLVIYWAIIGAVQAFRYRRQYLSSELQLERLEHSLARRGSTPCECSSIRIFSSTRSIPSRRTWSAIRS